MFFWFFLCVNILLTPINAGGGCSKCLSHEGPDKTLNDWVSTKYKSIFKDELSKEFSNLSSQPLRKKMPKDFLNNSEHVLKDSTCATAVVTSLIILEAAKESVKWKACSKRVSETMERYHLIVNIDAIESMRSRFELLQSKSQKVSIRAKYNYFWGTWIYLANCPQNQEISLREPLQKCKKIAEIAKQ